jgi:hypothetical protein
MKSARRGSKVFLILALAAGLNTGALAGALSLGASASWFMPSSADFRDAYGGGFVPGFSLGYRVIGGLNIWAGGEFYSKTGELTYTGEEAKFMMTTLYAGLRLEATRSAVRPYLAGALGLTSYKEESVIGTVSGSDLGFLGQLGLLFRVSPNLFLDVFGRYVQCKAKPEQETAVESEIGGLQAGAGISLRF